MRKQDFSSVGYALDDLVYFTTGVPDTGDTSVTRMRNEQHECYTNDTSATRVKTYFYTPILAI